jgi:hypothetical protein
MHNKVVTMAARSLRELGATTVRFNFRGAGASAGAFDGGDGELDDLRTVVAWARAARPNFTLWLGGFSFGAYVSIRASAELEPALLLSIAPPAGRWDFASVPAPTMPWLVIQGEADEIVDPQAVYAWLEKLDPPQLELVRMPAPRRARPGDHGAQVVEFADAFVEAPGGGPGTAEIESHGGGAELAQATRGHRHDLVVQGPALGGQRMADDGEQRPRGDIGLGQVHRDFQRTGHARQGDRGRGGGKDGRRHPSMISRRAVHGRSRSANANAARRRRSTGRRGRLTCFARPSTRPSP